MKLQYGSLSQGQKHELTSNNYKLCTCVLLTSFLPVVEFNLEEGSAGLTMTSSVEILCYSVLMMQYVCGVSLYEIPGIFAVVIYELFESRITNRLHTELY